MVPVWRLKSGSDLAWRSTLDPGKLAFVLLFCVGYGTGILWLYGEGNAPSAPAPEAWSAPLSCVGLWLMSLFFVSARSSAPRSARLLQGGVLAYIFVYAVRAPLGFAGGSLALWSWLAWPFSLALELASSRRGDRFRFFTAWTIAFAAFLTLWLLRLPYSLASLPVTGAFLARALTHLHRRYPHQAYLWLRLPLLWIIVSGFCLLYSRGGSFP